MKKLLILGMMLGASSVMAQCDDTNLSSWAGSATNTNSGEIAVTDGSALGGTTCGLAVSYLSSSGKGIAADDSPTDEQRYRAAMCIDPNSIALPLDGVGGKIKMHNAQCKDGTCADVGVVQFKLRSDGAAGYEIRGYVRDSNTGSTTKKFTVPLTDAPHRVEYDVDLTAGTFKLWVDATSEGDGTVISYSGLDMAAWNGGIDEARVGSMNNPANVTPGVDKVMFVDEFESRRQTFIGGSCN